MSALRRQFLLGTLSAQQLKVVAAIRAQILDVLNDKAIIANRLRDFVNYIIYNPDIFPQWHFSVTAKLFSPTKFKHKQGIFAHSRQLDTAIAIGEEALHRAGYDW